MFTSILGIPEEPFFLAALQAHPATRRPFHRDVLEVIMEFITLLRPNYKHLMTLVCVSGALIMASIGSAVPAKAYGQIGGLHLHHIGPKALLQLLPSGETGVNTMVLCHRNETTLEELKVNQCLCIGNSF